MGISGCSIRYNGGVADTGVFGAASGFDPHNSQQVTSYAVMNLRGDTRDVFLLSCVQALDYALIGGHLGLTVQAVQAHMASALCEVTSTIDFIERVRPRRVAASNPEDRHV